MPNVDPNNQAKESARQLVITLADLTQKLENEQDDLEAEVKDTAEEVKRIKESQAVYSKKRSFKPIVEGLLQNLNDDVHQQENYTDVLKKLSEAYPGAPVKVDVNEQLKFYEPQLKFYQQALEETEKAYRTNESEIAKFRKKIDEIYEECHLKGKKLTLLNKAVKEISELLEDQSKANDLAPHMKRIKDELNNNDIDLPEDTPHVKARIPTSMSENEAVEGWTYHIYKNLAELRTQIKDSNHKRDISLVTIGSEFSAMKHTDYFVARRAFTLPSSDDPAAAPEVKMAVLVQEKNGSVTDHSDPALHQDEKIMHEIALEMAKIYARHHKENAQIIIKGKPEALALAVHAAVVHLLPGAKIINNSVTKQTYTSTFWGAEKPEKLRDAYLGTITPEMLEKVKTELNQKHDDDAAPAPALTM